MKDNVIELREGKETSAQQTPQAWNGPLQLGAYVRAVGIKYKGKLFQSKELIQYIGDHVNIVPGIVGEIDVFEKDGKWICCITSSLA